MPKRYSREFRRAVCERLVAGENVTSLSEQLQISQATLFRSKRQALIHAGLAVALVLLGGACGASSSSHSATSTSSSSGVTSSTLPTTTSTSPTTTAAAVVSACLPNQLLGTAVFNTTQSELGAIKLSNTASERCSLSGRPTVAILGDNGIPLSQLETTYHRAPDWPPPSSPIVLSASGALPQAIVEIDWIWCGPTPHEIEVRVRFSGWSSPLDIPGSAISPPGFSPATCSSTGSAAGLFAVDYVRGFGASGIIGPSS